MRGGEETNLVDQKMDVAVAVRLEQDMAVFLRRDLAFGVQKSRNAVLLHDRHVLLLQTVVIVVFQESDRTGGEGKVDTTHCWFRHSS